MRRNHVPPNPAKEGPMLSRIFVFVAFCRAQNVFFDRRVSEGVAMISEGPSIRLVGMIYNQLSSFFFGLVGAGGFRVSLLLPVRKYLHCVSLRRMEQSL